MSDWKLLWTQFRRRKIALIALIILALFFIVGLYAPLLASSKPLLVLWNGKLYSPLLRYLFYPGFYSKPIDLFYNLLMFTLPLTLLGVWLLKGRLRSLFIGFMILVQCVAFGFVLSGRVKDPGSDPQLEQARAAAIEAKQGYRIDPLLTPLAPKLTWEFDLRHMNTYGQLNMLLRHRQRYAQHTRLSHYANLYQQATGREAPTLWHVEQRHEQTAREELAKTVSQTKEGYHQGLDDLPELMEAYRPFSHAYQMAAYELEHAPKERADEARAHFDKVLLASKSARAPLLAIRGQLDAHRKASAKLAYLDTKQAWLETQNSHLRVLIGPLIRDFHWEDDAGGVQSFNTHLPWWELSRINRKDLAASLIFGIRISIVVGLTAVLLSLIIGIPLGMLAGYFAGKTDIIICRFIEIWEAMPTFFMLLLVVAITQSKSIFLVIGVLGIFGWTSFGRFIRAETLKQRTLPYVMACTSIGYPNRKIMFSHILPNAIPPILTLLPFSMMAAITSEAGISFLGLGEEGSTSWGVLMDEGRNAFPGESYLLWPPAILLTLMLVSIAIVGDGLRDALDPKMRD